MKAATIRSRPNRLPLLVTATLCFIWGSTWPAIRIGLRGFPPFLFAGVRFLVAAALLYSLVLIQGKKVGSRDLDWKFLLPTSFFMFGLPYGLVFWGEQYVSAGLGAILNSTIPFFVALFSVFLLPQERLTFRRSLGLLVGFGGVLVIFSDRVGMVQGNHLYGEVALLGSAVCYGLATVWVRRHASSYDPQITVLFQMLFGAVVLLGAALVFERGAVISFSIAAGLALLYLAVVGSALAFAAYFWLLKRTEASKASLIAFVTPIVALLLGWALLGETLTLRAGLGAALVGVGIVVVTVRGGTR